MPGARSPSKEDFNGTTAFLLREPLPGDRPQRPDRFNATTAFLLRVIPCFPADSPGGVSMPPRRSCFLSTNIAETSLTIEFQCHHGVPASWPEGDRLQPPAFRFQCHHGVPASGRSSPPGSPRRRSFNATTAFLLPDLLRVGGVRREEFQCHHGVPASSTTAREPAIQITVSMPPRRSCFPEFPSRPGGRIPGFNATTAFLLHVESLPPEKARSQVSMPPRRSCFRRPLGGTQALACAFQCHHGVPASKSACCVAPPQSRFQCHHGVPASGRSTSRIFLGGQFRCHHGVPASPSSPRPPFSSPPVSMPPRRSCFARSVSGWDSGSPVSMPPRRSCFPAGWLQDPGREGPFQCHHGVPASGRWPSPKPEAAPFQCHHGVPASMLLR